MHDTSNCINVPLAPNGQSSADISGQRLVWILNGCGLEGETITGSPHRFNAVSTEWHNDDQAPRQHLVTTGGGERMLRRMGCQVPLTRLPASLLLRREPHKFFRLWSYLVTTLSVLLRPRRLPPADVAITVSDYFCDIVPALILKRRHGTRWIAWIHHRELHPAARPGKRLANELTWRMQAWSFRRIARFADQVWLYDTDAGEQIATDLELLGLEPDRIRYMRNGIDLPAIEAVPEPEKRFDAVMVGVRPNKGAFDIVPVWREVQRLRPGTTLCLMGGMSCRAALEAEIAAAGLSTLITFASRKEGWLEPAEHFARIKEARILFAPSHEEGWGIAHCEAMGCGLPVAAYDLPVYRRIFGEALATVPVGDHQALAALVVQLLESADLFTTYQRRGALTARNDNWQSVAANDLAAVRRLVGVEG